jgi:hypothetical protein
MTRSITSITALGAMLAFAPLALAQDAANRPEGATTAVTPVTAVAPADAVEAAAKQAVEDSWKKGRPIVIQYFRAADRRGINVFETSKDPGVEFTGVRLDFNAAFTSQVQSLDHSNAAVPNVVNGVNTNQLADIGFGFNNSTANLGLHAQLAPGLRVALTSYLSSRHHPESWVKDGYLQMDEAPIDFLPLKMLMQIATIRVGHMEINYGDAHFRRSDNGNAVYNPFVGNYIMDAFTTEIGGEAYLKLNGLIAMASITGGELRGTVLSPGQRGPSYIGKVGFDRQVRPSLRVRLTGSMYSAAKNISNTLYGGDRAGSRYFYALENTAATEAAQSNSGTINPGFKNEVRAFQVNPFVKLRGLEVFGVLERAEGKTNAEAERRQWDHYAVDTVYRFLPNEAAFVGVRYNRAEGELAGIVEKLGAERWQVGLGWFLTPGLLMKAEYVNQEFFGYPSNNIRNGGQFKGMMLEGVVVF